MHILQIEVSLTATFSNTSSDTGIVYIILWTISNDYLCRYSLEVDILSCQHKQLTVIIAIRIMASVSSYSFNRNHKHTTILNPVLEQREACYSTMNFPMIICDDYMILRKGVREAYEVLQKVASVI